MPMSTEDSEKFCSNGPEFTSLQPSVSQENVTSDSLTVLQNQHFMEHLLGNAPLSGRGDAQDGAWQGTRQTVRRVFWWESLPTPFTDLIVFFFLLLLICPFHTLLSASGQETLTSCHLHNLQVPLSHKPSSSRLEFGSKVTAKNSLYYTRKLVSPADLQHSVSRAGRRRQRRP